MITSPSQNELATTLVHLHKADVPVRVVKVSTAPTAGVIQESYLAALMRQNCHDASWRMEQLLSKVEQGESLDTRSTSIQLREAREELQQVMRSIEGIQKLCEELESDDS